MRVGRAVAAAAVLGVASLVDAPCGADEALGWRDDEWGTVQQQEYGVAFTVGALTLVVHSMPVAEAHWRTVDTDERARELLRFRSSGARAASRTASDLLFYSMVAYPVVDSLAVALPRDDHTGWQMLWVSLETLSVAGFVSVTLEHVSGRRRPYARFCHGSSSAEYRDDCTAGGVKEEYKSFPSGHSLMAFTGAGLACAHHQHLPLYGGGAPDAIACGLALGLATGQSLLRVTGDRHYLTDILVGGFVGAAIGYGLPMALHYGRSGESDLGTAPAAARGETRLPVLGGAF